MEARYISLCLKTLIWLSTASAINFDDATPIITTESFDDLSSYVTTEKPINEPPTDNGMVLGEISDLNETRNFQNVPERKEDEDEAAVEAPTVLITFPENHKNFTPSQYLGDSDYPPYFTPLNNYQQQYKNYYDQKQYYNPKPVKFEENSTKNLYLLQGIHSVSGDSVSEGYDQEKEDEHRVQRKPFPYVFEGDKVQETWTKDSGHRQIIPHEDSKEYLSHGYQNNILPYYLFPYSSPYQPKYYNKEVIHQEHHEITKDDKLDDSWKKVFKVMTALIPIGLFLATLTPNVISINSTVNTKTTRQRAVEDYPMRFREEDAVRLLKEFGVDSLSESQCEDRVICELARRGDESTANSIEKGFWFLANETPWEVAEKAGMNELFKAIKDGTCEVFKCGPAKNQKISFEKKLIRKHKAPK